MERKAALSGIVGCLFSSIAHNPLPVVDVGQVTVGLVSDDPATFAVFTPAVLGRHEFFRRSLTLIELAIRRRAVQDSVPSKLARSRFLPVGAIT